MDSVRNNQLTGHVKHHVALLIRSDSDIVVRRPPCKQQQSNVDCGLFAIAFAVEYCFTREVKYIDYDEGLMRSHWLKCLADGHLTPFLRSSRPKKSGEEDDVTVVQVFCDCRLPSSYGNLIQCEACSAWFHLRCFGLAEDFKGNFMCDRCVKGN